MKVCICKNISDRQIREALDQGARTLRDVYRELGVGSECGKCVCATRQIILDHPFAHLADEVIAA
jgi:bacterioferritin-associated ferredoxin